MLRGLYTSVSSMINLQERQSIITNNLANINTVGFKSETLVSKSFDEVTLINHDHYENGVPKKQVLGDMSFGVSIDDTVTNFSEGTHISTENNTDFAIGGNGMFQVQDFSGNTYYTRNGSFNINSQGYLVTDAGHNVMGYNKTTGALEAINVGNEKIAVSPNNNISINGVDRYSFAIVDFEDKNILTKVGDNLYFGENPTQASNFYVRQGYLEAANVNSINEVSSLMETVREFEASQKVIQTIDSTLQKIASEIGRV